MVGVEPAREEPLANDPLAQRITNGWQEAVEAVADDPSYKVQGSPGKGNWAEAVWQT